MAHEYHLLSWDLDHTAEPSSRPLSIVENYIDSSPPHFDLAGLLSVSDSMLARLSANRSLELYQVRNDTGRTLVSAVYDSKITVYGTPRTFTGVSCMAIIMECVTSQGAFVWVNVDMSPDTAVSECLNEIDNVIIQMGATQVLVTGSLMTELKQTVFETFSYQTFIDLRMQDIESDRWWLPPELESLPTSKVSDEERFLMGLSNGFTHLQVRLGPHLQQFEIPLFIHFSVGLMNSGVPAIVGNIQRTCRSLESMSTVHNLPWVDRVIFLKTLVEYWDVIKPQLKVVAGKLLDSLLRDSKLQQPTFVLPNGTQQWKVKNNSKLVYFRGHDLPTQITADGTQEWLCSFNLERVFSEIGFFTRRGDKPTQITANGTQKWLRGPITNPEYFRVGDKPTQVTANGTQFWFRGSLDQVEFYRDGGKPTVVSKDDHLHMTKEDRKMKSDALGLVIQTYNASVLRDKPPEVLSSIVQYARKNNLGNLVQLVHNYFNPSRMPVVRYISGPQTLTCHTNGQKTIYIFGETHGYTESCKSLPGAVEIKDYLWDLVSTTGAFVDLFLEKSWIASSRLHISFIGDIAVKFNRCFDPKQRHDQGCRLHRSHYGDIRQLKDTNIPDTIFRHLVDREGIPAREHTDMIMKFLEPFADPDDSKIIDLVFSYIYNDKLLNKELRKTDMRDKILNLARYSIRRELDFGIHIRLRIHDLQDIVRENGNVLLDIETNPDIRSIGRSLSFLTDSFMDAYLLSRVFRKFDTSKSMWDQPKEAHNIVIYAGDWHSQNYREFLEQNGYTQIAAATQADTRCLDMSGFPQPFFHP